MNIEKFIDRSEWELARRGRATGSKIKGLTPKLKGTGKKEGFYDLVAERLSMPRDDENRMARGTRLESEAIARYMVETGKSINTDLVIWSREDNPNIACSPDGYEEGEKIEHAVEVKCLKSGAHIQAYLTKEIPDEYLPQTRQYFATNDDLKVLTVVFYDPSMLYGLEYFTIEILRDDEEITEFLNVERRELFEIEQVVAKLKKTS